MQLTVGLGALQYLGWRALMLLGSHIQLLSESYLVGQV